MATHDGLRFPEPTELPEVQALLGAGWRPVDGGTLHYLLPAAWPAEHRTWVPDRLPRVWQRGGGVDGERSLVVPAYHDRESNPFADEEEEQERAALRAHEAEVGLPVAPPDRIWLLRSPWPSIPFGVLDQLILDRAEDHAPGRDLTAEFYRQAREVLGSSEDEVLAALAPDTRSLLEAWAAEGRVGEAAADVVAAGFSPGDLADGRRRTGLTEAQLLHWSNAFPVTREEIYSFVGRWLTAGLPPDPPEQIEYYFDHDLGVVRAWLDADFDIEQASAADWVDLDHAIRWRDAGYDFYDTKWLLRADPSLTPEEARAFEPDVTGRARFQWVFHGFDAAEAAAWSRVGLTAGQARLWRACSLTPAEVGTGQRFPPPLLAGREHLAVTRMPDGEVVSHEWDELRDPPGTRGRRARDWSRG